MREIRGNPKMWPFGFLFVAFLAALGAEKKVVEGPVEPLCIHAANPADIRYIFSARVVTLPFNIVGCTYPHLNMRCIDVHAGELAQGLNSNNQLCKERGLMINYFAAGCTR